MNEEETIEKIKHIDRYKDSGDTYTREDVCAISKLLNMYEQEKNKDLKEDFRCYARKVINGVFQDEYIKKSKIKNKIKELENYIQENSDEQGYWGTKNQEKIYEKIEILEELLEEEN